jgi:sugar transferase (PEP-CTERM/EpsH1 system associated)
MRKPTKILHVVHSLEVGGLENGLVNLLNRLDPERFKQTVCCLTSAGKFAERIKIPGIEIIELNIPAGQFRFPLLRLAKMFHRLSPHIVHTRGWPTVDAVFAARCARISRLVHGEHGWEHSDVDGNNWKRNQIRRLVGHTVDRYVIVCDFFRSWLNDMCRVKNERIVYIPNGVDTERFRPLDCGSAAEVGPSELRKRLRCRLGLPPDTLLVGTVGRLDPVKDFPTLMKGFNQIKEDFPRAKLVIVGDGPVRSKLTRIVDELDLAPSVIWLGERDDIPELLRCFDVFVQASIFEGMSNTILEAMASGLPIVTTNTGGNPELVTSGENGILVQVGDAQGVGDALARYLADSALRKSHGSNSRERAIEYFDLSLMATRYAEMYETLGSNAQS